MRRIAAREIVAKKVGKFPTFSVKGVNGYGGEQNGDEVLFFELFGSKAFLRKNIQVPDNAQVQWASYSAAEAAWDISFGVWKSKLKDGEREAMRKYGIELV